jgi:hypothetical protein
MSQYSGGSHVKHIIAGSSLPQAMAKKKNKPAETWVKGVKTMSCRRWRAFYDPND